HLHPPGGERAPSRMGGPRDSDADRGECGRVHRGVQPEHRSGHPSSARAVVLVTSAMEDAPTRGNGVTSGTLAHSLLPLALGFSVLGVRPATGQEFRELVSPYLEARDQHANGEVAGRAYGDPRRPTAPDVPREGVSVLLFPYSVGFESEIDTIK